jgi:hypothetical protein
VSLLIEYIESSRNGAHESYQAWGGEGKRRGGDGKCSPET